jgi:hypothetical protein
LEAVQTADEKSAQQCERKFKSKCLEIDVCIGQPWNIDGSELNKESQNHDGKRDSQQAAADRALQLP